MVSARPKSSKGLDTLAQAVPDPLGELADHGRQL